MGPPATAVLRDTLADAVKGTSLLQPPALTLLLCFAGRGGVTGVSGPAGSSGEQGLAVEQPGFTQV